jgi:hypothetical protein
MLSCCARFIHQVAVDFKLNSGKAVPATNTKGQSDPDAGAKNPDGGEKNPEVFEKAPPAVGRNSARF